MFDPKLFLYYLSSFAGLVMVCGGIWLVYKQKIYIDRESNQITEIELPIGKFKTNAPALALFALGFIPLLYPMVMCPVGLKKLQLVGTVKGESDSFPVQIYVVVRTDVLHGPTDYSLSVPDLGSEHEYEVLYFAGGQLSDRRPKPDTEGRLQAGETIMARSEHWKPNLSAAPTTDLR